MDGALPPPRRCRATARCPHLVAADDTTKSVVLRDLLACYIGIACTGKLDSELSTAGMTRGEIMMTET